MSSESEVIDQFVEQEYKWGFYTDVETDTLPPGLNEDVIRHISAKKKEPEWLLAVSYTHLTLPTKRIV